MVVYHVENHPQAERVRLVHETAEIVRLAIQPNRCELPNSVVAPSEAAGKISHRHHFEHGDAAVSQFRQFPLSGLPCPFWREGPDVHFVNDLALEADAQPPAVVPPETRDPPPETLRGARPADSATPGQESNRRHPAGSGSECPQRPAGPGPQSIRPPAVAVVWSPELQDRPPATLQLSSGEAPRRENACPRSAVTRHRWDIVVPGP